MQGSVAGVNQQEGVMLAHDLWLLVSIILCLKRFEGEVTSSRQDALLSFAAQRYEEANLMFAQCSAERPENSGGAEESQAR